VLIELEDVRNCSIWGQKIAIDAGESPLYDDGKSMFSLRHSYSVQGNGASING